MKDFNIEYVIERQKQILNALIWIIIQRERFKLVG